MMGCRETHSKGTLSPSSWDTLSLGMEQARAGSHWARVRNAEPSRGRTQAVQGAAHDGTHTMQSTSQDADLLEQGSQDSKLDSRHKGKLVATPESWPKAYEEPQWWWHDKLKKGNLKTPVFVHNFRHKAIRLDSWWSCNSMEAEPKFLNFADTNIIHEEQADFTGNIGAQQALDSRVQPNEHILVAILKACKAATALGRGMRTHMHAIESGLEACGFIGNALVTMYANCGNLNDAQVTFDRLPKEDVMTWNAMIAGFKKQNDHLKALQLFNKMQEVGIKPTKVTFIIILKTCSSPKAIEEGKKIHALVIESGFQWDLIIGSALISMYSKCGSLMDACTVFDRLTEQDIYTWSAMIAAYSQCGQCEEALQLFLQMKQEGVAPNSFTVASALKTCSNIAALEEGKEIHHDAVQLGCESDMFIGVALISMYGKCGCHKDAHIVFDKLPKRDLVAWNALIAGYGQYGHLKAAFQCFEKMQEEGIEPDKITYASLMKACVNVAAFEQGKWLHSHMIQSGLELDVFVGSSLIDIYGKCGSLQDARNLFDTLPKRNVVTWNAMMAGYAHHGKSQEVLQLFQQMQHEGMEPDMVTFICMSKVFGASKQEMLLPSDNDEVGPEWDSPVGKSIIHGSIWSLQDAHVVFDRLLDRDVSTWNVLISMYVEHGYGKEALELLQNMQNEGIQPTTVTFVCILKACSSMDDFEEGRKVHMHIVKIGMELNIFVGNALIDMYGKSGCMMNAYNVFKRMQNRDVVTWTALISSSVQHGLEPDALALFKQMQQDGMEPNQVTFLCILKACANMSMLEQGIQVHALVVEHEFELDLYVASAVIEMYSKCGSLEDAYMMFERLPNRTVVIWNNLIGGYAQHGWGQKALQAFRQLQQEGMEPDIVTYICTLKACSSVGALEQGKKIHTCLIECGFGFDLCMGNTVIDMYCNCASLEDAERVFNRMPNHDVVTWTAMIGGYAQQSNFKLALEYFENMQESGVKPNDVTFLCLLSACARAGVIEKGRLHFKSMREEHRITPTLKHFNCMVHLLGHGGCLNAAEDLLETMPFPFDSIGWISLLGSCKTHGDLNLGKRCFDHAVAIDRGAAAAGYVLMSKIYAHSDMWNDVKKLEELRINQSVWKKPAKAFIEIENQVHDFIVGDTTHPQSDAIYAKLESLSTQMRKEAHIPILDVALDCGEGGHLSLPDVALDGENMEDSSCGHSERLAIAFGLVSTPPGTTVRVVKNLRVCYDCHLTTKAISRIEKREIIIKDTYCVHCFKDGMCCCESNY